MKLKLVAVAIAALAPVVAMLGYNEYAMRSQRSDEMRIEAAQAARQASSEVERIVEGLHTLLIAVRSMPAVKRLDIDLCNDALKSVATSVPNIRTIFVVDLQGRAICGSQQAPNGTFFADRDYFKRALSENDFVVGTYTKSRISDSAVLPVAMPVLDGTTPKAVVVSGIRLDWLQNRITERGVAPGNAVTIADASGTILARVPLPERFVGTVIPDDFQRLIHAEQPGIIEVRSQDGTDRVLGYRPISPGGSPLYVSAGFSKTEAFAAIDRTTLINAAAIAGGALVAFLAALFVGNRFLLAPIASVASVMERWRGGEIQARTGMRPTDELHAVGASLDALLDELDFRRQQNEKAEEARTLLVGELAHRVKNGFTLVQAIARQTFAKTDAERFSTFSQRLNALAGTYDLILSGGASPSSVEDVLRAALRPHIHDPDRITTRGPDAVLPRALTLPLSLVVHELATNATKYGSLSNDEGKVDLFWKADDGWLDLVWRETNGPSIATPTRKGFGSVLIENAFPAVARPRSYAEFKREGLEFQLRFLIEGETTSEDA